MAGTSKQLPPTAKCIGYCWFLGLILRGVQFSEIGPVPFFGLADQGNTLLKIKLSSHTTVYDLYVFGQVVKVLFLWHPVINLLN